MRFLFCLFVLAAFAVLSTGYAEASVDLCNKFPGGDITSDVTLGNPMSPDPDLRGSEYLIEGCSVAVYGPTEGITSTLTLMPNVKLMFGAGTGFTTGYQGALYAVGTPSNKVVFTSAQATPAPGDWSGIVFGATNGAQTLLDYCVVEYGQSNIVIQQGNPTIRNAIVRESASGGINLVGGSPLLENNTINAPEFTAIVCSAATPSIVGNSFPDYAVYGISMGTDCAAVVSGNTFAGDGLYPITADVSVAGGIGVNTFMPGSGSNRVRLEGALLASRTLSDPGTAFEISGQLFVYGAPGGPATVLTLNPGVAMRFTFGASLFFDTNAALHAVGVPGNEIIFSSGMSVPAPGDWEGITLWSSANLLDYVIVEYAGSSSGQSIKTFGGGATIHHTIVRHSLGSGISVNGPALDLSNLTLVDNRLAGLDIVFFPGGPFTIANSAIHGNGSGISGAPSWVTAENIFWGHSTGPLDDVDDTASGGLYNQNGQGDPVGSFVDYDPWAMACPDFDMDGHCTIQGDCNDLDPAIHPDASESCNHKDDDCDGFVDENFDADGDGFATCNYDCNDTKSQIHPGAPEACNLVDDNCNGLVDERMDQDHDGITVCQGDCNDGNPNVKPAKLEIPGNGIDDDCDLNTPDSGPNTIASYVAFASEPETRAVGSTTVFLDRFYGPVGWVNIAQQAVSSMDGTFSFGNLPDSLHYRLRAKVSWVDRIRTPDGDVDDNRSVEIASGDISITSGQVSPLRPLLFPVPVILVSGQCGGACLPMSFNGQAIACDAKCCGEYTAYWSTAFPIFMSSGFMTFIADGLAPCNVPPGEANLHEYNGRKLGEYIDYVWTKLQPIVSSNKTQVNLVAHSMGGLTARAYIARKEAKPLAVRKLIMLGTPNAGSEVADLGSIGNYGIWASESLGQHDLWEFNNIYGDVDAANRVPFYTVVGSGGLFSGNILYEGAAAIEPFPNDGPVSRQSAVPYNVPDILSQKNFSFRENINCHPEPKSATLNCLIRIPSERYLCTADDHSQLVNNEGTLSLVELLLTDQQGPNNEIGAVVCSDAPPASPVISEVGALQSQSATVHTTRISNGALLPLDSASHNHVIDASPESIFSVTWESGVISFMLQDPLSRVIDPAVAASDPDIDYQENTDPTSGLASVYTVRNPLSGTWILDLVAGAGGEPTGTPYSATTTSEADVAVVTDVSPGAINLGQTSAITVTAAEQGVPVAGGSVSAIATDPDGVSTVLSCADDGVAPDLVSGDGAFTCSYGPVSVSGTHTISATSSGVRMDAVPFERADVASLAVNAADVSFDGTFSETPNDTEPDGEINSLSIGVDLAVFNPGVFSLAGELRDSNGDFVVSAHVQGQALWIGLQALTLAFDGTTIRNHGMDGPYTLTNLSVRRSDRNLVPSDTAVNAYTTASYLASEFQLDDPDGDGVSSAVDNCPFVNTQSQTDTDLDSVGDACDNCPLVANMPQTDADHDGFGDACDLCPLVPDILQGDIDGDGLGDNCDTDADGDGVENSLDCNPVNSMLFSQAPEVQNLVFQNSQTLSWDTVSVPDGSIVSYDIVKGGLTELRQTGNFDVAICASDGQIGIQLTDPTEPALGQAFYYLVRSVTPCSEGSYGNGANGERTTFSCP